MKHPIQSIYINQLYIYINNLYSSSTPKTKTKVKPASKKSFHYWNQNQCNIARFYKLYLHIVMPTKISKEMCALFFFCFFRTFVSSALFFFFLFIYKYIWKYIFLCYCCVYAPFFRWAVSLCTIFHFSVNLWAFVYVSLS